MREVLSFEDLVPTHGGDHLDLQSLINIQERINYNDPGCVDLNGVYNVLTMVQNTNLENRILEEFASCSFLLLKMCEENKAFDISEKVYKLRIGSFEDYLTSKRDIKFKKQNVFLFEDYLTLANILFKKGDDDVTCLLSGSSVSFSLLDNKGYDLNRRTRYSVGDKLAFAMSKIENKNLREEDFDRDKVYNELCSFMDEYCAEIRLAEIEKVVKKGFNETKSFGRFMKSSSRNNLY